MLGTLIYIGVGAIAILIPVAYFLRERRKSSAAQAKLDKAVEAGLDQPVSIHPRIDPDVCIGSGACVQAAAKAIVERFGRLDILIANAGVTKDGQALKMSEQNWDLVVDVSLKGTFLCCQAAMRHMMSQKSGRIVTTASVASLGNPGQTNYSAAEPGIISLTKTLALGLAPFGITVNCVAPGAVDTPMLQTLNEEVREGMLKMIPLKRFAHPEEVAAAHLFFCSDEAAYLTGQVLFVDGGMTTGI